MREPEHRLCEYHGEHWAVLVETGWVTVSVDADRRALMLYHPARDGLGRAVR